MSPISPERSEADKAFDLDPNERFLAEIFRTDQLGAFYEAYKNWMLEHEVSQLDLVVRPNPHYINSALIIIRLNSENVNKELLNIAVNGISAKIESE